jgi:hypothetical protein
MKFRVSKQSLQTKVDSWKIKMSVMWIDIYKTMILLGMISGAAASLA